MIGHINAAAPAALAASAATRSPRDFVFQGAVSARRCCGKAREDWTVDSRELPFSAPTVRVVVCSSSRLIFGSGCCCINDGNISQLTDRKCHGLYIGSIGSSEGE